MTTRLLGAIISLTWVTPALAAKDESQCKALSDAGYVSGTRIPGYAAISEVVGEGRLQFFSAPDAQCKLPGVFVIPKDRVITYAEFQGYTAVMYISKSGESPMGWVATDRLRSTGEGISPKD